MLIHRSRDRQTQTNEGATLENKILCFAINFREISLRNLIFIMTIIPTQSTKKNSLTYQLCLQNSRKIMVINCRVFHLLSKLS